MKGIKKGLFSILISLIGIVSFCSADTVSDFVKNDLSSGFNYDVSNGTTWTNLFQLKGTEGGYICFYTDQNYVSNITPTTPNNWPYITFRQSNYSSYNGILYLDMVYPSRYICFELHRTSMSFYVQAQFQYDGYNGIIPINYFFMNDLLNSSYISSCSSQFTSEECQIEYNLIPISSVDSNYCETNNLCSSSGSGNCSTGDISWSSVYINDIQHIGGPTINMTIPEEISRDYNYSNTDDMYINVEGYNVDYDKINGIVDIQKYKPTSDDFTRLVSESVPLFVPGLVIILLVYFIFRFVKKIF